MAKQPPKPSEDLTGIESGEWKVLGYGMYRGRLHLWKCRCSCGTIAYISKAHIMDTTKRLKCQSCYLKERRQLRKKNIKDFNPSF